LAHYKYFSSWAEWHEIEYEDDRHCWECALWPCRDELAEVEGLYRFEYRKRFHVDPGPAWSEEQKPLIFSIFHIDGGFHAMRETILNLLRNWFDYVGADKGEKKPPKWSGPFGPDAVRLQF
jgi:hypothetical protein